MLFNLILKVEYILSKYISKLDKKIYIKRRYIKDIFIIIPALTPPIFKVCNICFFIFPQTHRHIHTVSLTSSSSSLTNNQNIILLLDKSNDCFLCKEKFLTKKNYYIRLIYEKKNYFNNVNLRNRD